jgi:2-polyprenyl-3-methyl-5-hydroxy-6-metoxy-1,4-benzoquinol methylase
MQFFQKIRIVNSLKRVLIFKEYLFTFFDTKTSFSEKKTKFFILKKFSTGNRRFGQYMPYQSFDKLNLRGQRNTSKRLSSYPLSYLENGMSVLDVGCNMGCLTLTLATDKKYNKSTFIGIDCDKEMIDLAIRLKKISQAENTLFYDLAFEDFAMGSTPGKFDIILCLAVEAWTNVKFPDFLQKLELLSNPHTRVLIESNNLDFLNAHIRWESIKSILSKTKKVIESGQTVGDDVRREWVLFSN